MERPYERSADIDVEEPVLVLGMEGWIDAGLGASAAMASLLATGPTESVATWDPDLFVDYRDRRPVVRIADGVTEGISWPSIELRAGADRAGRHVLALVGPEPDMRWHTFVASVVELGSELGVRLVAAFGAFPISVPHTRPVRLAATSRSAELAGQIGVVQGTITVPSGIHAAILEGFADAGVPAVGLWARVPHYAAAMPYPAASAALVEGLAAVAELDLDASGLHGAAALTASRIDELIASSDEHQEMVRRLEAAVDAEAEPPPFDAADLPTGDQIVAELERFLRGEGGAGS
ncbi:MAG TPA: PAC2 family protein [Acidimicrobiales bacterium]|nr:PAC2 family protein [Acidimicrobiales bacterium]